MNQSSGHTWSPVDSVGCCHVERASGRAICRRSTSWTAQPVSHPARPIRPDAESASLQRVLIIAVVMLAASACGRSRTDLPSLPADVPSALLGARVHHLRATRPRAYTEGLNAWYESLSSDNMRWSVVYETSPSILSTLDPDYDRVSRIRVSSEMRISSREFDSARWYATEIVRTRRNWGRPESGGVTQRDSTQFQPGGFTTSSLVLHWEGERWRARFAGPAPCALELHLASSGRWGKIMMNWTIEDAEEEVCDTPMSEVDLDDEQLCLQRLLGRELRAEERVR